MTAEERYRFLTELEQLFGVSISNESARDASSPGGIASLIAKGHRGANVGSDIAFSKSYLHLRLAMSEVLHLPQTAIRLSSSWNGYLPKEHPARCCSIWHALRVKVGKHLPPLRGPMWPWIITDFILAPMVVACCQRETANWLPYALTSFVFMTVAAIWLSRHFASTPPRGTIAETVRKMAEQAAVEDSAQRTEAVAGEIEAIVRSLVMADLGKEISDGIPFAELSRSRAGS